MAGEFSPATRKAICERAGDRCEVCRVAAVAQLHHRRPRGAGGTKRASTALASNGLALCGPCHHWCEMNRTESMKLGYLVSQYWEPSNVAVCLDGRFVFLTDSGAYEIPAEEAD